jgi:hypothetical protein
MRRELAIWDDARLHPRPSELRADEKQIVELETLRYRVTIAEAGQADPMNVSKTVRVDVLDFS